MKWSKLLPILLAATVLGIAGCQREGPAEQAGEAADQSGQAMEPGAGETGQAPEPGGDQMQQN